MNEVELIPLDEIVSQPDQWKLIWQPDALPDEPQRKGKQYEFLTSTEDFVGLDGGKGSGKTDLLIWDALKHSKISHPLSHEVIFRREYKRLTEVIDRTTEILYKLLHYKAHWQGDRHRFIFPSGARFAFHNLENVGDEQKYQGWQISGLKFDQLEEFEEQQFDFLILQNRSGDPQHLKSTVRWTANPPLGTTVKLEHPWMKKRLIDGKDPGKTYTFVLPVLVGEKQADHVITYKRIFATVFDNPLLSKDQVYISKLANDPNPYRRRVLFHGDWNTVLGQFFTDYTDVVHVIKGRKELPSTWNRLAGLDYGNIKTIEFLAADYLGNLYVEWEFRSGPTEYMPSGETASQFGISSAQFMLDRKIGEGLRVIADTNMTQATGRDVGENRLPIEIVQNIWNEKFQAKRLKAPMLEPVEKKGTPEYHWRVACNEAIRDYLHFESGKDGKIIFDPRLFILDRCPSIQVTLPALVADPNDPMDIADGQDDHDYDALKHAFMSLYKSRTKPVDERPEWWVKKVTEREEADGWRPGEG